MMMKHWRADSIIGQLMKTVMSWMQFQASVSSSMPVDTTAKQPHAEFEWICSVREALRVAGASIELFPTFVPELQRERDSHIMDHVSWCPSISASDIKLINRCRLCSQAVTVSDIATVQGHKLDLALLFGERTATSSFNNRGRMRQGKPCQKAWRLRRKACGLFALEDWSSCSIVMPPTRQDCDSSSVGTLVANFVLVPCMPGEIDEQSFAGIDT